MAEGPTRIISEDQVIGIVRRQFRHQTPAARLGIGDDAAVIDSKGPSRWVLTTDLLVEKIDFRRDWITPRQLGHKALAVNLSDVAAMGARPRFFLVALAVSDDVPVSWIHSFYAGVKDLARRHGASLVGGDLSRTCSGICITLTVLGEAGSGKVIPRSGGRAGDVLFVTGVLGRSAAGLRHLKKGGVPAKRRWQREALRAHRTPEPRCRVGYWLAQKGFARAMIDISDGFSTDLHRLCAASRVGAEVYANQLPRFRSAERMGEDALALALHGGEDFELLFAVSPRKVRALQRAYPRGYPKLSMVGTLRAGRRIALAPDPSGPPAPLEAKGFDHFSR